MKATHATIAGTQLDWRSERTRRRYRRVTVTEAAQARRLEDQIRLQAERMLLIEAAGHGIPAAQRTPPEMSLATARGEWLRQLEGGGPSVPEAPCGCPETP